MEWFLFNTPEGKLFFLNEIESDGSSSSSSDDSRDSGNISHWIIINFKLIKTMMLRLNCYPA